MKNKKALKLTLLSILLVIVAVVVFLAASHWDTAKLVFNWDNIVSFVNSHRYTTDDLETKLKSNKTKMEKIAKEDPNINIRGDLTEEEKAAYNEGRITKDEATQIVKGDTTLNKVLSSKENSQQTSAPVKQDKNPPADKKPEKTDSNEDTQVKKEDRVSEIIAELYVIQADFLGKLQSLGDRAYADYKATNYDRSKVMSIVDSYTGTVTSMESECDATVEALLSELKAELQKVGGDQSTVKEIRNYYYNEKSLKKSYYLNKMYAEDYK